MKIELQINECKLSMDTAQLGTHHHVPMLTTEWTTEILLTASTENAVEVNGQPLTAGEPMPIQLTRLHKDESIMIAVPSENWSAPIQTLPPDFPDMQVLGQGTGMYYTALMNYMFKMDQNGHIVFYKRAAAPFDFKPTELSNGIIRYSYSETMVSHDNPVPSIIGVKHVKAVVMDEKYQVIREIPYLSPEKGMPQHHPLELHDFMIMDENTYLLSGYVAKRINNIPDTVPHSRFGARVLASVLQMVRYDGDVQKLLWQWDSTDYPQFYGWSEESNDYFNQHMEYSDYMHFNSITLDPADGNFVCSFRHLNAIVKIDRGKGSILWALGGKGDEFALTQQQRFCRQHFARFTENGNLTIFDNASLGNALEPPYTDLKTFCERDWGTQSRVLEFKLDQANKRVENFKEFIVEQQYSVIMGSAQRLSQSVDIFLIGWGGRKTPNALFSEVNFTTGEIAFEVLYPHTDTTTDIYRAYHLPLPAESK